MALLFAYPLRREAEHQKGSGGGVSFHLLARKRGYQTKARLSILSGSDILQLLI